jgi:hypothetical protein
VVKPNHRKIEKRLEKFIPRWQHHPRLDTTVRNLSSPCRHAKEVADVIAVIIFMEAAMEKPNPPFLPAVVEERG